MGEGGGGEISMGERDIDQGPLVRALTRDRTCNPGTYPDWESNQRPFVLRDDAQPTEPHWSGLDISLDETFVPQKLSPELAIKI